MPGSEPSLYLAESVLTLRGRFVIIFTNQLLTGAIASDYAPGAGSVPGLFDEKSRLSLNPNPLHLERTVLSSSRMPSFWAAFSEKAAGAAMATVTIPFPCPYKGSEGPGDRSW